MLMLVFYLGFGVNIDDILGAGHVGVQLRVKLVSRNLLTGSTRSSETSPVCEVSTALESEAAIRTRAPASSSEPGAVACQRGVAVPSLKVLEE